MITEIELLSYPNLGSDEEQQIRNFLTEITVVLIEMMIKEQAIALRKQHRLRLPDAMILATAIALNATLLTNDAGLLNLSEVCAKSVSIT
jgi:predicted nucleic acid-binding protein